MATFRIHEDQENLGVELRRNHKDKQNASKLTKRTALGDMNKKFTRIPMLSNKLTKNELPIQNENIFPKPLSTKPFDIPESLKTRLEKPKPLGDAKKPLNDAKKPLCDVPKPAFDIPSIPLSEILKPRNEEEKESSPSLDIENQPPKFVLDIDLPMTISPIPIPKPKSLTHVPIDVEEYKEYIDAYLREMEKKYRPKPNYMKKQHDINYSMRSILVEWLVEVAEEYKLQTETLYLAVGYIDRFLSQMSVVRAKLQLLGTAAMFIAAKYEEIYPPDIAEFVYITDDTYTKKQVLRMEQLILGVLHFNMSSPTVLSFITSFCVDFQSSEPELYLAMYITELSLLEGDPYLEYLPSGRACAAIALARHTLSLPTWDEKMEKITAYTLDDLKPIIQHLTKTFEKAPTLTQQAIREKYKTNRFSCVSLLLPKNPPMFQI